MLDDTVWLVRANGLRHSIIGLALSILFANPGGYSIVQLLPR